MELFIPSVLILLLAAAVIFFVLPRFGAPVLALISVGLLAFGVYQHMNSFGTEYRLSTWQQGLANYSPYIMIGGLLVVVAFYLLMISPLGKPTSTAPELPTINEMPSPNTATNAVTAGVNNALKGIGNVAGNAAAAIGLGNAAKANNKGLAAPAAATNAAQALNKVANEAATASANALSGVTSGVNNALKGFGNAFKNVTKPNNKGGLGAALGFGAAPAPSAPRANMNNRGLKIPGTSVPLSQI